MASAFSKRVDSKHVSIWWIEMIEEINKQIR